MKTLTKILAIILIVATLFSSSVMLTQAKEGDPSLTGRDDFYWGSVLHAPTWGPVFAAADLDTKIHQLAEMGGKLLRIDATGDIAALDRAVQLCNAYGIKVMIIVYIPGRTFDASVDIDADTIHSWFYTFCKRYDGTSSAGHVDYIQLDNEMDVAIMGWTEMSGNGSEISEYPEDELRAITNQVLPAVKGIRDAKTDTKIIINFAWVHYGLLKYFKQNGVDWDITGHDWYSDMFGYGGDPEEYYASGQEVYDLFGKPIIICETNIWTNSYNGKLSVEIQNQLEGDEEASAWDPLIQCLENYYEKDFVIGCTIYEFYDELGHEKTENWAGEAHFGLIKADKGGNYIGVKPIYNRLKTIFGGKSVTMINYEDIRPKTDNNSADDSAGTTTITSGTTTHTQTIITPDPLIVTPEPINKEITNIETVYRKVPVPSGKFFTWPVIVGFIVLGVALTLTAVAVTYTIIRKKKNRG